MIDKYAFQKQSPDSPCQLLASSSRSHAQNPRGLPIGQRICLTLLDEPLGLQREPTATNFY
jgi:hypothetical protein